MVLLPSLCLLSYLPLPCLSALKSIYRKNNIKNIQNVKSECFLGPVPKYKIFIFKNQVGGYKSQGFCFLCNAIDEINCRRRNCTTWWRRYESYLWVIIEIRVIFRDWDNYAMWDLEWYWYKRRRRLCRFYYSGRRFNVGGKNLGQKIQLKKSLCHDIFTNFKFSV